MREIQAGRLAKVKYELWWFLPAFLLFLAGALIHLDTPGIYMDAVNPDYFAVRLLGQSPSVAVWALPGTVLFGLFPVVGQIYHGALPYWLGLPFYALFGTGVLGIRLTNTCFGTLVLLGFFALFRAFGVRRSVTALVLAALALDPAFTFTFRSQFYILMLPTAFLASGAALVERSRAAPRYPVALLAGFLTGVAVYGYFIHLFLAPACLIHACLRWRRDPSAVKLVACWVAGAALAVSPYAIGLVLILVATGGWSGFTDFLARYLGSLAVTDTNLSLAGRLAYYARMINWTVLDVGPMSVLLGHPPTKTLYSFFKEAALLLLPWFGVAAAFATRVNRVPFVFVLCLVTGLGGLFLAFGNRVWLTHAIVLLPILYLGLALALEQFLRIDLFRGLFRSGAFQLVPVAVTLPLMAGNANDRQTFFFELEKTGGVGLASNSYQRFATDMLRDPKPLHVFFPDWGLFMGFAMVTRGAVPFTPEFQPALATQALCEGRDVVVATVEGKPRDRIPVWVDQLGGEQPAESTYFQRDGVPALTVLRWSGLTRQAPLCAKS